LEIDVFDQIKDIDIKEHLATIVLTFERAGSQVSFNQMLMFLNGKDFL
jgi:hypothetical protein